MTLINSKLVILMVLSVFVFSCTKDAKISYEGSSLKDLEGSQVEACINKNIDKLPKNYLFTFFRDQSFCLYYTELGARISKIKTSISEHPRESDLSHLKFQIVQIQNFYENYPKLIMDRFKKDESRWPLEGGLSPFIGTFLIELDIYAMLNQLNSDDDLKPSESKISTAILLATAERQLDWLSNVAVPAKIPGKDSSLDIDIVGLEKDYLNKDSPYSRLALDRMSGFNFNDPVSSVYFGLNAELTYKFEESTGCDFRSQLVSLARTNSYTPKTDKQIGSKEIRDVLASAPELSFTCSIEWSKEKVTELVDIASVYIASNNRFITTVLYPKKLASELTEEIEGEALRSFYVQSIFSQYLLARMTLRNTLDSVNQNDDLFDPTSGLDRDKVFRNTINLIDGESFSPLAASYLATQFYKALLKPTEESRSNAVRIFESVGKADATGFSFSEDDFKLICTDGGNIFRLDECLKYLEANL